MSKITPGVLAPPHEVLTPDEWRARGRERRSAVSGQATHSGHRQRTGRTRSPFSRSRPGAGCRI